jgi:hypothetical protein
VIHSIKSTKISRNWSCRKSEKKIKVFLEIKITLGFKEIFALYRIRILGAFVKLRKATIGFIMYASPSVRKKQHGSHWTELHEIWYSSIFLNLWRTTNFN